MKKKIIIILSAAVLVIILVVVGAGMNFLGKFTGGKAAAKFVSAPITRDKTVNEKMQEMRSFDSKKITFEPKSESVVDSSQLGGLKSDSPESAEDNSKILNRAIKKAKKGTKIVLPEGKYYLAEPLRVTEKSNLTISSEGKGAVLINAAYSPFTEAGQKNTPNIFEIFGCEKLRIENLSFDYLSQVTAEGIIVEQTDTATTFRAYKEYLSGEKTALQGGEKITSVFTASADNFKEENWPANSVELEKKSEEIFSIPLKIGAVGEEITCRFNNKGFGTTYVINVTNTNGLILENLRCYSCPGGFVLATHGNSDLCFKKLWVEVAEGSERTLGSNEDCLHLRNVAGRLIVEDSRFYGIGDDALNIHSALLAVEKAEGNSVFPKKNTPFDCIAFAQCGETVEFFNSNYESLGFATVKKVGFSKITFEDLPEALSSAAYIQNVSRLPDTYVRNCEIGFARARGLLIQSKNCIIENCDFRNIRLSGILAAPDFEYWLEGGFCDNLLIENNRFKNCATAGNGMGVIHISGGHDGVMGYSSCSEGHKNVSILANQFEDCKAESTRIFNALNLKEE